MMERDDFQPQEHPSAGRTPVAQRAVLLALALLLAAGALWTYWPDDGARLWAQGFANSPLPEPTPTRPRRVVNEILSPQPGDAMARSYPVVGTALIPVFNRYEAHLSPAGMEAWTFLYTSHRVVYNDVLFLLDTTQFPDGLYDLRIRAINDSGNYTESFVRGVEIRNANPPTPTPPPGATAPPFSALPVPTPTPTPDPRRQGPEGQGFFAPDAGAVVRGDVPIIATVNGRPSNPFVSYQLDFSQAGLENWQWLAGGETQVWQGPIAVWETTRFPDGLYDLRLRIVYRDGNYNEYFLRNLSVANQGAPVLAFAPPVGITAPRANAMVSGVMEVRAVIPELELLRWELAWSPGGREQWQHVLSGEEPFPGGVLARLDVSRLPAGLYDLRLRIVRRDANYIDSVVRGLRVNAEP